MSFNIKKLAMLTMPTMVMFAVAACGGSSSSSSPSPSPSSNFDPAAPSKVETSSGGAVSPGGLSAPTTELPAKSGKLIVQVMDERLGSNSAPAKASGAVVNRQDYSAYFWHNDEMCPANTAAIGPTPP